MEPLERGLVLIVGDSPLSLAPFHERDLKVRRVTFEGAQATFNEARAVVIADFPDKFGLIKDGYAGLFPKAQNQGLAQIVTVHTQANLIQAAAIKQKDFPYSNSRLFLVNKITEAAEFVARYSVGPPVGDAIIEPPSVGLSEDDRLLLQRAFHDCARIFLEPIPGGMASIGVFKVHAWLKQSLVGPRPLPFFVKIATPESVKDERENYRLYAEHYIPFNLRPNLDRARCVGTRSRAALVGNFVDDAVPLRSSLRSGHGVGALFSLFETSLKGFRLQPFAAGEKPIANVLEAFARGRMQPERLKDATVSRARAFGLKRDAGTLQLMICGAARQTKCVEGPFHGDLHSGNVMVRGGDAILIDFSSAGRGPLTADPAALEVSLIFGTDEFDKEDYFAEWREFVDEVYTATNPSLHPSGLFESRPGPFSWLRRSLRELRHILLGCNGVEAEAVIVLAAYLLRYARLDLEHLTNESLRPLAFDRHAYALVIAERIVESLSLSSATTGGG